MIMNTIPCPFCGKTKLSIDYKSKNSYKSNYKTYLVRCNCCRARGSTVGGYVNKNSYVTEEITVISEDALKAKAIELWNIRK